MDSKHKEKILCVGISDLPDEDSGDDYFRSVDEWMDRDYDDMKSRYDDYWELHFANMELPPAVEAPVPWFPTTSTYSGDEFVHTYENFTKFGTVEDYSDHHYAKTPCPQVAPEKWSKRIQEEWKILEKDLPAMIYVRAYESRMDLLRAVIIGAEGTPYHHGLFFFDVYFPTNYPHIPPVCKILSKIKQIKEIPGE